MSHASTMPLAAAPGDTALLAGSLALFDDLVVTTGPQRRRPGRLRTPTSEAPQRLQRPPTLPALPGTPAWPSPPPPQRQPPRVPVVRERAWPTRSATPASTADALSPPEPTFEVIGEPCQSLLRINDWEGLRGSLAVNPYRGCTLGCQGCPSVSTRVYAKVNAAEQLRDELRQPRYQVKPIQLGTTADAYQHAERTQRLTRGILQLLHDCGNPVVIVTRSTGVLRDVDLLLPMAQQSRLLLAISLCTLDEALSRQWEPLAPTPAERLAAMKRLAKAGVPVALHLAPQPSLASLASDRNDADLANVIEAAAKAGASMLMYRLQPDRHATADGSGPPGPESRREKENKLIELARQHGLSVDRPELDRRHFRPPAPRQPTEQPVARDATRAPVTHGPQRSLF
ncbi:radical SAM protein [Sphaerotilus microaerophilus]|uniref:Radical SAM core domain-containing protein n=1 Tax=Sphaerotilus microaerophilus TaxID=2914710 RepID=A0ABM7YM53_9BURK|nr:radical SAM protein [Sphaerotilus sp. FB-5]BDI05540.1 hypothetical protein CATMQ487_25100 [Sphaerotilus sp. FB-5]